MEYRPPSETLPIFDSSVFRNRNASLTFDEAKKYFLEWPRAQGPETLQETTIIGALTCASTATFGTAGSADNIPTCIADYSTILPTDSTTNIPTTACKSCVIDWAAAIIAVGGCSGTWRIGGGAGWQGNIENPAGSAIATSGTNGGTFFLTGAEDSTFFTAIVPSTVASQFIVGTTYKYDIQYTWVVSGTTYLRTFVKGTITVLDEVTT
jgi:hypothetical protein